jgi:hypothetical protein
MSATVAAAHAALTSAVSAASEPVDPPACIAFSGGSDIAGVGGKLVEWRFTVTCYVGWLDNAGSTAALAALVQAKLVILWALAGWRVLSVSPDTIRTLAGGEMLSADIAVSTYVELA